MAEDRREQMLLVARELDAHRDELIAEVSWAIRAQIRAMDRDARLADFLKASNTENVVAAIHFLERGYQDEEVVAPQAAIVYARVLARQGDVPLSALIRAYRIGHSQFLDAAIRYATALTADRSPVIIELVNQTARWIDTVCDQVGVAYEEERDRWVSSRSGLRQQWVSQLLDGAAVDISRAEDVLQYRFDGVHVAAVVWPEPAVSTAEAVTLFDQVMALLTNEFGAGGRPLMVPTDEREVRMWFSVPANAVLEAAPIRTALENSGLRVRLAVGDAEDGLAGFRRSLLQAERVKAVALAGTQRAERVILYGEVAPLALMAGDLDGMRRFVVRVLGELATDSDRNEWLRETLREFLARNRSYAATAEALFLHRNTIQYRVAQAMERCGHSLDDPEAVLNVQFALQVCRWLAPAVLQAPMSPTVTGPR
jgi:DNA-binding PucR family transcriptional regulator